VPEKRRPTLSRRGDDMKLLLLLLFIGPVMDLRAAEIAAATPTIAFSFTVPTSDDSSRDCITPALCPARSESLTVHWLALPKQGQRFGAAVFEDSLRLRRGAHPTISHAADSTRWFLVRVWPTKPNVVAPCRRVKSIVLKAR